MKRILFVLLCSLWTTPKPGVAQRLDIGGVELRVGEPMDSALRALSIYTVRYNDTMKNWMVTQLGNSGYTILGSIAAASGRIWLIVKYYDVPSAGDVASVYTTASRDLRARGGPECTARAVKFTDNVIHEFETVCGRYTLDYLMPMKAPDGQVSAATISITVR